MPPLELGVAALALFAGTVVAVRMAMARPEKAQEPKLEDEDVADFFTENLLVEQERKHPELIRRLREHAKELGKGGRQITTDDIWETFDWPSGIEPRNITAAFPRKDWIRMGERQSKRKSVNHGRRLSVWMLREYLKEDAA